jgi:leucyl aminopeptidase
MDIKTIQGDIADVESPAIVVNIFEGVTEPSGATGAVDRALQGAIAALIADGEIKGGKGEMTLVHTLGKLAARRVLVAGLGKAEDLTVDVVRGAAGETARFLRTKGVVSFASVVHGSGGGGLDAEACAQAMAEGALMGLYRFNRHKSDDGQPDDMVQMTIVERDGDAVDRIEAGLVRGRIIAEAVNLSRDMANEPANFMTPTEMAEQALAVATETGIEIQVLDRPEMGELGMGALLGVAQGSEEPPKLIVLKYRGDPDNKDNSLGMLGKGITFDSGGLDIKSASGMATMKSDMAGGASVIGAMKAIAQLKPKLNVTGIVPATENMPGGKAQRPGDVVRTMSGKTIEIGNTDAEGRLVLADAVSYARSLGLARLVDVATLTGAVIVALGDDCTGVFGNNQDWIDRITRAGARVGERMWQLPTYPESKERYRSDVADIKNTGTRGGGAITGAMIIGEFAEGAAWAHLDIAGTDSSDRDTGHTPKGATGGPVRTLVALAEDLASP